MHAYFAEKETLLEVFDAWPDQMGAVILLEEEGDGHNISLYHEEEADRMLSRLGQRLGLSRDELILVSPEGVGPAAEGHPRVRIKFSDDRGILDLISHRPDLPERARDYKINFEYVRDQGLGTGLDSDLNPITPEGEAPLIFTPIPKEPPRGSREEVAWGEIEDEAPSPPDPGFRPTPDPSEDLVCVDVPAAPDLLRGYRVLEGVIRVRKDRVLIQPRGHAPSEVREVPVTGFRDDLSDLLLPADALEGADEGRPPVLSVPTLAIPEGLLGPTPVPRRVRISVTPWGVRVRPVRGVLGLLSAWPARGVGLALLALLLALNVGLLLTLSGAPLPAPSGP